MLELSHKNLDVWKLSINFVLNVYKISSKYPKEELFGLTAHTRRSSVYVPSNIAEGSARKSPLEKIRYYEISRASLVETDTQIEIANGLGFLSLDDYKILNDEINTIFAKLSRLMESVR
ncbi:MAG: four helix bundle protein [Ignavibacteriales bacterium]|nr:four helix bundle protein [Ignavibacteriales bacterium]